MSVALKIIAGDNSLVLLPGTKIKMIFKSPFFMESGDTPTRSFIFNVPAAANQFFFKFANLLDVIGSTYIYQVKVELNGSLLGNAIMLVEEFSNDLYKARVTIDRGNYTLSLSKKIRDFNFKSPTPFRYNIESGEPTLPHRDYNFSFSTLTPSISTPVNTLVSFWSTFLQAQLDIKVQFQPPSTINEHIDHIVASVNNETSHHCLQAKRVGANQIRVWDLAANDQFPDITFLPENLDWFEYFNDVVLASSSHPNPIIQEYLHIENVINNPANFDYIYYPVYVPNLSFGIPGFTYRNVINHYFPSNSGLGPAINGLDSSVPTNWIKDNVFMPYAYLYKTLKMILEELRVELVDDFFDEELKTLTFWTPLFMQIFQNNISAGLVTRSFQFSQILPDVKLGELLDGLKLMFGMLADFNSRDSSVRLVSRKKIINSQDYDDWSDKITYGYNIKRQQQNISITIEWPSDETLVKERIRNADRLKYIGEVNSKAALGNGKNNEYKLVWEENNLYRKYSDFTYAEWFFYGEGLEDFSDSLSDTNYILKISTLFCYRGDTIYTKDGKIVHWLTSQTNQPIYRYDEQPIEIKTQLLFYRGIQPVRVQEGDSPLLLETGEAPLGTYHNYDINNNKIGNYNLSLNHPDGLVDQFLKEYIEFKSQSSPVSFQAVLTAIDIHNLNLLVKKKIDNQRYLLDEVEVEFENGSDVIGIAKVTAWPLKYKYDEQN